MQDFHGTLAEKLFDERAKRLLCGLDPYVAVCGFEDRQSTFCAVLCREKERLLKFKKLCVSSDVLSTLRLKNETCLVASLCTGIH
jgi:hypothetical protein